MKRRPEGRLGQNWKLTPKLKVRPIRVWNSVSRRMLSM